MECFVYRSSRKADTYLYLPARDEFSELPEGLLQLFGKPVFSFSFDLTPDRKLVRENAAEVFDNLADQGFHLQIAAENKEPE